MEENPTEKKDESAPPKKPKGKAMRDIIQESIDSKTKEDAVKAAPPAPAAVEPVVAPPPFGDRPARRARGAANDINFFLHQLGVTLNSGLPLARALRILGPRVHHAGFRAAVAEVTDDVERGAQFWAALGKHPAYFNKMAVNIIRSGEESGTLVAAIDYLAGYRDREEDAVRAIQRAITYPLFLLIVVLGVVLLLTTLVIPMFAQQFKATGMTLPFPTRVVLNISSVMTNFWLLVAVFVVAGYIIYRRMDFSAGLAYAVDRVKIRLPIFGPILVKIYTTQFATMTALLLKSGMPVLRALDLVRETLRNGVFRNALLYTKTQVEKGRRLAESLAESKTFPPIVSDMVAVGEDAGSLPIVLEKVAETYQKEVTHDTAIIGTLLEPMLIIILGLVVAFVAFSLIMPYFKLAGGLAGGIGPRLTP
jgi:type IV pilus assembly protein PilC